MNKIYQLFNLQSGEEDKNKVKEDVQSNISFKGANLWILACAILIASIGLNVNSTAVIIGAMLISPLMGPIVGSGFALATYDFSLLKRSAKNLFIATIAGLIVSCIYFYLSPFKDVQSELLARTSPTIYDVLIAFFGGIVGAVSITRVEKGNPIPGVAIATALMPPLCTAGFGLATLNFKFLVGALYLYSINCFFIALSTFIVLKYLKYKPVQTQNPSLDKKVRISISVVMSLLIIPSFYLAYNLLQEKKFTQNVETFIQNEFLNNGHTVIYKNVNFRSKPKKIELAFLSQQLDSLEIARYNTKLEDYGINNTTFTVRQNNADLKQEILSELNKNQSDITEKDLKIQQLNELLKAKTFGDSILEKEIKILFPDISQIYFGTLNQYSDSISNNKIILYQSEKLIDENKLQQWIETKYATKNIIIQKM
ncbi:MULTISPECIES: DUF389 domain-containing protein [Empedobacter]|uniref:DUF389 domain-containing protein n=1 Tax=Empedobacter TaxID=59734 RepID=UPI0024472968|nr:MULTISPECIES: DUF389 domain-containing protein [Empedobacter]MDH0660485.1 DUF389 domain-containing protein [Empedobacter sp. GD03865]MDH0674647.1 DUF389 domain-containing protein [Empedobacter sp. GD03861]MDH1604068.1 DUF389 domain-containing protein [Empedobacter sp. GD03739]MDM1043148.1 DUF389 domain-containing protein [Empedobacter brevis]MDM1137076.1 DUF389 domain-containing protein [Empedobacter sp. R750]